MGRPEEICIPTPRLSFPHIRASLDWLVVELQDWRSNSEGLVGTRLELLHPDMTFAHEYVERRCQMSFLPFLLRPEASTAKVPSRTA